MTKTGPLRCGTSDCPGYCYMCNDFPLLSSLENPALFARHTEKIVKKCNDVLIRLCNAAGFRQELRELVNSFCHLYVVARQVHEKAKIAGVFDD